MAMLVARYRVGESARWGLIRHDAPVAADDRVAIYPIAVEAPTTADLIAHHAAGPLDCAADPVAIAARDILSPITTDAQLVCQGLNYTDHVAEAQHASRKQNLFFGKASSSITGAYDAIRRPSEVQLLDYEVEFGLVMRAIPEPGVVPDAVELGRIVAGVVLANDVSARDVQFGASFFQWYQGKSYRTFCPLGPVLYLLEPEEVAATLLHLEIRLWVNGELRQSANSAQLIYPPAETLAQLSGIIDLRAGDVVLTGTPGGVTSPATPTLVGILKEHLLADGPRTQALREEWSKGRPFLAPGDMVTATLRDGLAGVDLGGLANRVVAA